MDGLGEVTKRRCGLPYKQAYERDSKFAFIENMHNEREEQGESIIHILLW
jgi:hypothetical protein